MIRWRSTALLLTWWIAWSHCSSNDKQICFNSCNRDDDYWTRKPAGCVRKGVFQLAGELDMKFFTYLNQTLKMFLDLLLVLWHRTLSGLRSPRLEVTSSPPSPLSSKTRLSLTWSSFTVQEMLLWKEPGDMWCQGSTRTRTRTFACSLLEFFASSLFNVTKMSSARWGTLGKLGFPRSLQVKSNEVTEVADGTEHKPLRLPVLRVNP